MHCMVLRTAVSMNVTVLSPTKSKPSSSPQPTLLPLPVELMRDERAGVNDQDTERDREGRSEASPRTAYWR